MAEGRDDILALARTIPWWVWLGLALAGAFWMQEVRIQRLHGAQSAARDAQFRAALQQIDAQRTEAEQARAALGAERAALQKDVAANAVKLRALEGRSQAAAASTTQDKVQADALVAHPSYVALEASAARLGVKVKAVVR